MDAIAKQISFDESDVMPHISPRLAIIDNRIADIIQAVQAQPQGVSVKQLEENFKTLDAKIDKSQIESLVRLLDCLLPILPEHLRPDCVLGIASHIIVQNIRGLSSDPILRKQYLFYSRFRS
jgi:hypothetical protein